MRLLSLHMQYLETGQLLRIFMSWCHLLDADALTSAFAEGADM